MSTNSAVLTIAELHSQLQLRQIILTMDGTKIIATDPDGRLTSTLDAAIRAHRGQLAHELQSVPAAFMRVRQSILMADLDTDFVEMVERLESILNTGEISQSEYDTLLLEIAGRAGIPAHCIREAHSPDIPRLLSVMEIFDGEVVESDDAEVRILVSDLLGDTGDNNACFACGQSKWWTKEWGELACAICHPPSPARIGRSKSPSQQARRTTSESDDNRESRRTKGRLQGTLTRDTKLPANVRRQYVRTLEMSHSSAEWNKLERTVRAEIDSFSISPKESRDNPQLDSQIPLGVDADERP